MYLLLIRSILKLQIKQKGAISVLKPLFDKNCEFIGWIEPEKHIFNQDMDWVAYISDSNAWSAVTGNWIGSVHDSVCLDTSGKIIAWSTGTNVRSISRPSRPNRAVSAPKPPRPERPEAPEKPEKPEVPADEWSSWSIGQWLHQ